jgi:hypothetical protein
LFAIYQGVKKVRVEGNPTPIEVVGLVGEDGKEGKMSKAGGKIEQNEKEGHVVKA